LRRGISALIGGAFEQLFCPEGREFEQANLHKFKFPGGCPGGGGDLTAAAKLAVSNSRPSGTLPSKFSMATCP